MFSKLVKTICIFLVMTMLLPLAALATDLTTDDANGFAGAPMISDPPGWPP